MNVRHEIEQFLKGQSALTALTDERIWVQLDMSEQFFPELVIDNQMTGPGILVNVQGGTLNSTGIIETATAVCQCYGQDENEVIALSHTLITVFDNKRFGHILGTSLTMSGQAGRDASTNWLYMTVTFQLLIFHPVFP